MKLYMGKGRLLWFRKLLPLNSLQRAYCFCIIIPNVSKSAFSQYLKHSQLPHKYHFYSCTAFQHIKEYHLPSSKVTPYDYLSQCLWTQNKDREEGKILSKQNHGYQVLLPPRMTQDSSYHVFCMWGAAQVIWPRQSRYRGTELWVNG